MPIPLRFGQMFAKSINTYHGISNSPQLASARRKLAPALQAGYLQNGERNEMTEEEIQILKAWIINTGLRFDSDLEEARQDFRRSENTWLAFRLALAGERKQVFDNLSAQIYALLKL